ncbi:MAG: hypothetical protein JJU00_13035 [Opitutales bacterium]|nr:hypothetical protein [Opitutales bacterium]
MTPDFRLTADGQDFTALIRDRLIAMHVVDHPGEEADRLTLVLDDRDHRLAWPRKGALLSLELGYTETGLVPVGRYIADEVAASGPAAVMEIEARAADLRETLKTVRTESYPATTLAAIAETVAARHGLEPRWDSAVAALGATAYDHIDQADESDMHLLTRLFTRQHGLLAKPAGPYLVIVPRGRGTKAAGDSLPEIELRPAALTEWRAAFPDRERYLGVTAAYIEYHQAERITVRAGGEVAPLKQLRGVYPSKAEAVAAAEAEWDRIRRSGARLQGTLPGDPRLLAGGPLALANPDPGPGPRFRPEIEGRWVALAVRHRYDPQTGFTTAFEAEPRQEDAS